MDVAARRPVDRADELAFWKEVSVPERGAVRESASDLSAARAGEVCRTWLPNGRRTGNYWQTALSTAGWPARCHRHAGRGEPASRPDRRQDVVAITTAENNEDPGTVLFPAESLFERMVALRTSPSRQHAYALGKEQSVFRQAVQTRRPSFDPDSAQRHPLTRGAIGLPG